MPPDKPLFFPRISEKKNVRFVSKESKWP